MSIIESQESGRKSGRAGEDRDRVRQRRVDRLERRWGARKAINLFIVWHLFALAMWLLPDHSSSPSPIVEGSLGMVRPYMTLTGFAQSWNMFSPEPDKMDVYLEAEISYRYNPNGKPRLWLFPRLARMSYSRRYEEERWRKLVENATHGSNTLLWPPLARYAARVNNYDAQNPPVSVKLIEHSRIVPPLGEPIPPYTVEPLQTGHGPSITPIRPEDLR